MTGPTRIRDMVYAWDSQAAQHPPTGAPNSITYRWEYADGDAIECVNAYDGDGDLVGILYRYPYGAYPWEVPGAINVWVHPEAQRRGYGLRMILDLEQRTTFPVDWSVQQVTPSGEKLYQAHLRWRRQAAVTTVRGTP